MSLLDTVQHQLYTLR